MSATLRSLWALYAKELRTLAPLMLLGFALISGDLISRPATERIDENTYDHVAGIAPGEGGFLAFIFGLVAFFVAYAAFPREHDEKSLDFLVALPTTRPRIFATKVLAGLTALWGVAIVGQVTNFVLQVLNPDSIDGHQMTVGLTLRVVLLHGVVASVLYAHGLFASVFRLFGLLPYALAFFASLVLVELMPSLAWVSPGAIVTAAWRGSVLLIPWATIAFHVGVALIMLGLAYLGWMGPFAALRETTSRRGPLATALFVVGALVVGIVGFVMLGVWAVASLEGADPPADPSEPQPVADTVFADARATTSHYDFVYASSAGETVARLVSRADRVLEGVVQTVGAGTTPSITVDLAESSGHHEGIAAGTRIRMGLAQADWRLVHVLAHESAHVLQAEVSSRHLMDYGTSTRFLIEGGAEWVAFETLERLAVLTPSERENELALRRASRIVATASFERHRLRFEDALDDETFRASFDTTLAYPFGETMAEAIARACGDAAVGAFFASFAEGNVPQGATGLALVRDRLSSVGCDTETVLAAHEALLVETAATERAVIDAIPRLRGGVVEVSEVAIILEVTFDEGTSGAGELSVRVRPHARSSDTEVRAFPGQRIDGGRARFVVPRATVSGDTIEFLFSIRVDPRAFPFSESWQSAPLRGGLTP